MLPSAQLLLEYVYGRPLPWASLRPEALANLAVLAHDHGLPALLQACIARLMHSLASQRPAGPPGPHIAAAAAAPASPTTAAPDASQPSYLDTLVACATVPPDVSSLGAFAQLQLACRALLRDLYADLDAAWREPKLRAAFCRLPLAAALDVLSYEHLAVSSEAGVLLATMAYDAAQSEGSAGAVAEERGWGGTAGGGGGGEADAAGQGDAWGTVARLALYGCVRWHLLHEDGRPHNRRSFLRNALARMPHLGPMLEHGSPTATPAAAAGGAEAVPELAASAAACGPSGPAASLPDLAALLSSLLHVRRQRLDPETSADGAPSYMGFRAPPRPRPTGHTIPAAHLHMDVPYERLRGAVARVAARLDQQRQARRQQRLQEAHQRGGARGSPLPASAAPPSASPVEEDIASDQLWYHDGYFWQMVVSVGPLCRYQLALSTPRAPAVSAASAGRLTPAAAAAAAAAAAHEADERLCCYVGVRPLLLLTEREVAAATGRTAPADWHATAAVQQPQQPQSQATPLPACPVYAEVLDVWNERELPAGKLRLGPTAFSPGCGFRGSAALFEAGAVLMEEGYWAKVLSQGQPSTVLRLRARLAGVS